MENRLLSIRRRPLPSRCFVLAPRVTDFQNLLGQSASHPSLEITLSAIFPFFPSFSLSSALGGFSSYSS
jgi:hypothetical protein